MSTQGLSRGSLLTSYRKPNLPLLRRVAPANYVLPNMFPVVPYGHIDMDLYKFVLIQKQMMGHTDVGANRITASSQPNLLI